LHPDEVIKAAQSFGTNSNVTTIKLSGLRLDDKFALAMAQSLQQNTAIVKLDLETNMFGTDGMIAIVSSLSANRTVAEVFLRHQTKSLASADEERIPNLIADNPVIVKLSLDVRSTISKHSIESKLRQNQEKQRARNRAASAAQTDGGGSRSKSAARNRIQKIFDSVGANDSSITEVQVVCDQVFLSLNPAEILKTAESFAGNTHVRTVKLSGLRLDDAWAVVMAKSLESNTTIEAIDLESNAIGSTGMLALVATLASSTSSVTEFLLRHQSKPMSSVDEEQIPGLIGSNEKIVKLSMDVRGHKAKCFIDQKIRKNQELRRKNRNNKK
jgi:NLR family CARD domain-containing protein 3